MTESELEWRYSADDLPPIKNRFIYFLRICGKVFAFAFFGLGSVVLAVVVFPIIRIFMHPRERFQKVARAVVSATFRFFSGMLHFLHLINISVDDRNAFKNLKSKIIVANHPSILDVVFIISLVPNADCIVRGGLTKTILAGVIKQLYIVNSLGYEEMIELSKKSLATGTNIIVFPEGTRTPRHGTNVYKKGAARIAYETGCDVQPVYIGGNDKYGLGKHDKFLSYNHTEVYCYDIHILEEIKVDEYKDLEPQIAAKRLTSEMHKRIASAAEKIDGRKI